MSEIKGTAVKKAAAFVCALAVTASVLASSGGYEVTADTQSELEAQQEELAQKRTEIERQLAEYEGQADETEQYLEEYDEKMRIQEEQITNIDAQIALYQADIDELSAEIEEKEADVEEGIEQFRQRLRSMYISGTDSYASVLAGSVDFYDILARMEFVERVSRYDNKMIEELKEKIVSLNSDKADYEEKITALESKKSEEEQYYDELRETYNNHAETKAMQDALVADYAERYDEIVADQEEVEAALQEEIRRKQKEAEERRKAEEEKRRQEEEEKKKQAEANGETYEEQDVSTFTSYSETGFIWPVPTVRNMTDTYGYRYVQEEGTTSFHGGIDINKPNCAGEPIVASAAGEVLTASNTGNGFGNHVVIDHGNGISTLYAHCSSLAVSVGDIVEQGQVIGYIGCTGYAYGNHCHFEVRIDGQRTDPLNYVNVNN
jgi:murein DD-endopeptidase MepM/ murein hydrolase activator NlpD